MKANKQNTAIVIPVYNSEKYLAKLLTKILHFFPKENIFAVDDGSSDKSAEICSSYGINLFKFLQNSGKGSALKKGFEEAIKNNFVFAITLDSDLQHDPDKIPDFIKKQNEKESDLVIGKRNFSLIKMPLHRICSNTLTSFIVSLVTGYRVFDSQSGYRLYNLNLIGRLNFVSQKYQFETEIILKFAKLKARIDFIEIETIYSGQKSYILHFRDIMNFIKIVIHEMRN